MRERAETKLARARTSLILDHPFFGTLCLRMKPVADRNCATAWTDGRTFGFNPAYVSGLSEKGAGGLLAHTVMHAACGHHVRRGNRDARLWNMACDHAVNWILTDAGLTLPPGYLDDPKYRGQTADAIYTELAALARGEGVLDESAPGTGPEKGETERTEGAETGKASAGDESEEGETVSAEGGEDPSEDGQNGEDAGDPADGAEDVEHSSSADPGGSGEVRDLADDSGGGSPEGGDETDDFWRAALAQAVRQARDAGDLPGGLERLVRRLLYPKLDWRELLDRFVQARARNDYSWTPPNRRYLHMGLHLPSLSQESLPELVLAVDTSGSVSPEELEMFAAELRGVLEPFDTTLRVYFCDREITGEQEFRRDDPPLELEAAGGGGDGFPAGVPPGGGNRHGPGLPDLSDRPRDHGLSGAGARVSGALGPYWRSGAGAALWRHHRHPPGRGRSRGLRKRGRRA